MCKTDSAYPHLNAKYNLHPSSVSPEYHSIYKLFTVNNPQLSSFKGFISLIFTLFTCQNYLNYNSSKSTNCSEKNSLTFYKVSDPYIP